MGQGLVGNQGGVLHIFGMGEPVGVNVGIMRVIDDTMGEM
jgi:hypothetical protein